MLYKRYILFFASLLFVFFATTAHAQLGNGPDPIEYGVSPEVPGPNDTVYITLRGLGSFLGNSSIVWQENGKVIDAGVGHTNFVVSTGGVGTVTRVHVTITSSEAGTFAHDFYFAPSVVYLTWEADTSAPLFYKGKTLYSAGSNVKVVALPFVVSGKSTIPSSQLSFQWKHNNQPVPEASGKGRNVFIFTGDQLQDSEDVSVDVRAENLTAGHADMHIPAVRPGILLYDRDPLRGEITERALPPQFTLSSSEITLQAEPYFFSNSSVASGKLGFSWTLNDTDTVGPDSGHGFLTLRQTGQGAGSAIVGVAVQNLEREKFIQEARQTLQLTFGQSGGNALSTFLGI